MITQPEYLKNTGLKSNEKKMSENAENITSDTSMSSVADSPARIFPMPGKGQDLMASEADCFSKPFAWFANYDRDILCWRTWQGCLLEVWTEFSGRWPRSGMTRNGIAYRLPTLAHRISGTGSSSSGVPTPTSQDRDCRQKPGSHLGIHKWVKGWNKDGSKHPLGANRPLWPTPCLLYTSPSPRDQRGSRMPSSA